MKFKHPHHAYSDGPQLTPVRFEFSDPTASIVCIAGTFNDWQPKPMHAAGNGWWLKESTLPPGIYEYCLVVDGQWMPDPGAIDSVPNPFGGRNSLLKVACVPEADSAAATGRFVLPSKKIRRNKPAKLATEKRSA